MIALFHFEFVEEHCNRRCSEKAVCKSRSKPIVTSPYNWKLLDHISKAPHLLVTSYYVLHVPLPSDSLRIVPCWFGDTFFKIQVIHKMDSELVSVRAESRNWV